MNKLKRLISQALFWVLVWFMLWLNDQSNDRFVSTNSIIYALQILLILCAIYYTVPKLLFKKKHFNFSVFSIAFICIFSYLSSNVFSSKPQRPNRPPNLIEQNDRPPPPHFESMHSSQEIKGFEQKRNPKPIPRNVINILMLSLSYILATLIETFLFVRKKEEETILIKNENLQNELKLLKSQINPHFLFNSLNNIYALSAIDSGKTQQSISHLSDMLRYVLYECEQESVPLKKEIKYIENYLKLFALKSSKPYPITTHFEIQNNNIFIAPMLFIPFIENALKHSNIENKNESFIDIKVISDDNNIKFEVSNSLPKTSKNKDKVGGIGLENVKKRLAILYPKKHDLIAKENENSFDVNLKINLK